jgi:hypothetical protein
MADSAPHGLPPTDAATARPLFGETPSVPPGTATDPRFAIDEDVLQPSPFDSLLGSPGQPPSAEPVRFGKFDVLGTLATGGMGVIFRAVDRQLGRTVALKVMRNRILPGSQELLRFHREAQSISQLAHPHIIPVYEFGEIKGSPYFAMPLAGGGNLLTFARAQPGDRRRLVEIMENVAQAVAYAHRQGIVHRDLKPGNILISDEGEPLLADFGLAKLDDAASTLTESGALLGTPSYMAPEQIAGSTGAVGPAADIWALGVILYELLTGALPFAHAERHQLFKQIQFASPPRPRALNTQLDARLEHIILRCLEKAPEDCYASAEELADELADWRVGAARRALWADEVRRWGRKLRRQRRLWVGALIALLLLALSLALGAWYFDEGKRVRALKAAVERGEPVHLLGETGSPAYWNPVIGAADWSDRSPLNQPFTLSTAGLCAAELLPAPLPEAFRFEAEVRQLRATGDQPEAGIYCLHSVQYTPAAAEVCLVALLFSDLGDARHRRAGFQLQRNSKPAGAELVTNHFRMPLGAQPPLPPIDFNALPWRRLALEVRTHEVEGFLDNQAIGKVQRNSLHDAVKLASLAAPQNNPAFDPARIFQPTGGIGLILHRSVVEYRNVVVTPLHGRANPP